MGVPKFYRWISERYPNINQIADFHQLPDFDNFYLDMNGIIHSCSHVQDDNSHTIVTEKEIIQNVFHYIDFLFRMIKPKKVFYMAIDGVAPRAKMNQQRSRRFRSGQDRIKNLKTLATKSGKSLDELIEQHFDSNAITPGTEFMETLDSQLKYFINWKITTDPLWEGVEIHFSGHLTPGEGEHKIMDYIRYTRSQPGYNVNTRHCLYGLDADLIMLTLVSHESHFVLLREQVQYGSRRSSRILSPEEIKWELFFTSLLRDYIDLEFRSIKDKIKFPYDLSSIIDDWILICYLVGNDFIPHLPHIHIREEALVILWDNYKRILPQIDGYINEAGDLNLKRFEFYINELSIFDHQRYANENDTFKNLNNAPQTEQDATKKKKKKNQTSDDDFNFAALDQLSDCHDDQTRQLSTEESISKTNKSNEDENLSPNSDGHSDGAPFDDEDSRFERERNDVRRMISETIDENDLDRMPLIEAEFRQHKNYYYREKLNIEFTSVADLKPLVDAYIIAIQWILKYYYQGCPSWSWFYPYHYAPYLSDLKNFQDLKFDMPVGSPFKPYEQLLGVLPPSSKNLLPKNLQELMTDPKSPLLKYYPENFKLDQNEKKNSWEYIVLLPFIDEKIFLETITNLYPTLEPVHQRRNQTKPSLCYLSSKETLSGDESLRSNPYFPPLNSTRATVKEIPVDAYCSDREKLKFKKFDNQKPIVFDNCPVLNALPYSYGLKKNALTLSNSFLKPVTLVLSLNYKPDPDLIEYNTNWTPNTEKSPPFEIKKTDKLIERYLGEKVFFGWPHFQSGVVCAISDFKHLYVWSNDGSNCSFNIDSFDTGESEIYRDLRTTTTRFLDGSFEINFLEKKEKKWIKFDLNENQTMTEYRKAIQINEYYERRQGTTIGPIPILLYVGPILGYRNVFDKTSNSMKSDLSFLNQTYPHALQTTLLELENYHGKFTLVSSSIENSLQVGESVLLLKSPYYGCRASIQRLETNMDKTMVQCLIEPGYLSDQPDLYRSFAAISKYRVQYLTATEIGQKINLSPSIIGRITGRVLIFPGKKRSKKSLPTNIGLGWKLNNPLKFMPGYSKQVDNVWVYSPAAIEIINEYLSKFPELFQAFERTAENQNYYEQNIWATDSRAKVNEIRLWIKSLPTFTLELVNGNAEILDLPVVEEIDRLVKLHNEKHTTANDQKQTLSCEVESIFKPSESLGLCKAIPDSVFYIFDRVVIARFNAGLPLGAFGTIVGIIPDKNELETFYDILFDNLPEMNLDKLILEKQKDSRRIKVKGYQLINYSHWLRTMNHEQTVVAQDFWVKQQISRGNSRFNGQEKDSPYASPGSSHSTPFFTETNENPLKNYSPDGNSSRKQYINRSFTLQNRSPDMANQQMGNPQLNRSLSIMETSRRSTLNPLAEAFVPGQTYSP